MTKLAVVADDLTGALDASAPFAAHGLTTMVALRPEALPLCLEQGPEILGVSINTRETDAEEARNTVADCVRLLSGVPIFKKIDSRLKGNIEAELDAIAFRRALVIPAIPEFDRWVRDGRLGGFGVDEHIDIRSRLGRHAAKADIPDASTMGDIEAAVERGGFDLPVGARGLAEVLARRMASGSLPTAFPITVSGITFVMGSRDPITKAQVAALREAVPHMTCVAGPDGMAPEHLPARSAVNLIEAMDTARSVSAPTEVARRLAEILLRLLPREGEAIVISGGSTAQVVLETLGIDRLELVGEVLPGLPIARAKRFTIITKSGGFGDRQTLVRLLDRLSVEQGNG